MPIFRKTSRWLAGRLAILYSPYSLFFSAHFTFQNFNAAVDNGILDGFRKGLFTHTNSVMEEQSGGGDRVRGGQPQEQKEGQDAFEQAFFSLVLCTDWSIYLCGSVMFRTALKNKSTRPTDLNGDQAENWSKYLEWTKLIIILDSFGGPLQHQTFWLCCIQHVLQLRRHSVVNTSMGSVPQLVCHIV